MPWLGTRIMKRLLFTILPVMALIAGSASAESVYPVALMNWMVEGTFHALIVDKSQQRLTVWRVRDGEPSMVESFRCSTGENEGDKWVRGDMKTPEGVYFFCSVIDGRTLPPKYGLWAFTTDYPNFVDRRRGKNGDGIWLHGRDKPLGPRPDSNGCVALENEDLVKVSRYIRLQSTPLIVVNKLLMAPRPVIMEQEREIRDFIESWRQAWVSQDLEAYMSFYSPNFQSNWFDFRGWKEKKRRLNDRYKNIKVKLSNIYLYRQNGLITAIFNQTYASDGFRSSGIKVLYLAHERKHRIFAEDYHKPADDPFPVGPLLARAGADPEPAAPDAYDLRIRLVSTDEPEELPRDGELESPRPSAPSRGVVLQRLAQAVSGVEALPLESNERHQADTGPQRLMVAAASASLASAENLVQLPAARQRTPMSVPLPQSETRTASLPVAAGAGDRPQGMRAALTSPAPVSAPLQKKNFTKGLDTSVGKGAKSEDSSDFKQNVLKFLDDWKSTWEKKDLDRFAKMYHPDFEQGKMDYAKFVKSKKNFFRKYRTIRVNVERVDIRKVDGRILVKFVQLFQGDEYRDTGWKSMVLDESEGGAIRIRSEGWSPL